MEGCTRSLVDVCRREQVSWDVTTCGWSEEEEQDRVTRYSTMGVVSLWVWGGTDERLDLLSYPTGLR